MYSSCQHSDRLVCTAATYILKEIAMLVLFAAAIDCCDIITFFCVPKLVELFLTITPALLVPSWPGIHSYFAYFMLSASGGLADTMALKCSQLVDFI